MAARPQPQPASPDPLTQEQREAVEVARAEVLAGRTIAAEDVDAWIESWDTDDELPMPQPRPDGR